MIRGIVAIDEDRGMADENGIPWNIPGDQKYFVDHLATGTVLMGRGTYDEVERPFGDQENYVAVMEPTNLRDGFVPVLDVATFLRTTKGDIWNIGGPGLLSTTLDALDEVYITQLEGSYGTTKFLPEFRSKFHKISESDPITENGITYRYQVWARNKKV
ncbi:MAG TPA: dihydrofolate reductase [Candidatus Saccharimonadaceae bacterium]|nr:dihydrofolate reductase [Candidatus Saccharimonadaceae bacterium]